MKTKYCVIILFLFLTVGTTIAQNLWTLDTPLPGVTRSSSVGFSIGSKGYITTGYNNLSFGLNETWEYDPSTSAWTQKANYPGGFVYGASGFTIGNYAYVGTGWDSPTSYLTSFFRYDPVNNQWDTMANFPGGGRYTTVAFALNGKGYITLGYKPYSTELWQYDPDSDSWALKAPFPGIERQNCAAFVINDKAYVGLGANQDIFTAFDDFYEYNPDSDVWTQIPSFPGNARYASKAFVLNDKGFVGTGLDYSGTYYNDMYEFDPVSYSWTQVNDFGGSPRGSATVFTIGNVAYMGSGSAGVYYNDFWKFSGSEDNIIQGQMYVDGNNNQQIDSGETAVKQVIAEISPINEFVSSDHLGVFSGFAGAGTFNVTIPNPPLYYIILPASNTVSFSFSGEVDTTSKFAFVPVGNINDLRVTLTPITNPRGGMDDFFNITYKNVGTTPMSGDVSLVHDNVLSYISSIPVDTNAIQNGDTVVWLFSNLQPGETRVIQAKFDLSTSVVLGDTIHATAIVNPIAGDSVPADNYDSQIQIASGSFDPNDKQVSPEGDISPLQVSNNQWLEYTIRFQNTGNADAINIRLTDTLSTNLYLPSFEMLASSHGCTYEMKGAGVVQWRFDNIHLPDSGTDLAGSQGFVKYRVRAKNSLILGDIITNTAGIYFDYNAPIITNTTLTQVALPSAINDQNAAQSALVLFPNPNQGYFNLEYDSKMNDVALIEIYNSVGQVIYSLNANVKQGNNKISIQSIALVKGIYLLKVKAGEKILTTKFSRN